MTMDLTQENERKILTLFQSYLSSVIAPHYCDEIAFRLRVDGIVTEETCDKIIHAEDNEKFKIIHQQLLNGDSACCFQSLLNSLPEGLAEVKQFLEGNHIPTSEENTSIKQKIEVFHRKIVTTISAEEILLKFPEIFDQQTREFVLSKKTSHQRAFSLMYSVLKSDNSLGTFMNALESKECGDYSHIVDLLKGIEATPSEKKTEEGEPSLSGKQAQTESVWSNACWDAIKLLEGVEPLDIVSHFSLGEETQKLIHNATSRDTRVEILVNALALKPGWFGKLISSLQSANGANNYSNLIQTLGNSEVITEKEETAEKNSDEKSNFEANSDQLGFETFTKPNIVVEQSEATSDASDTTAKMEVLKFQEELAKPAIDGHNCVIVSQTGTGKTFVAVKICHEHLLRNKDGKVVFLVHKVPLVLQQFKVFQKNLYIDGVQIEELSGQKEINSPTATLIQSNQVIIMTHDILGNNLRSNQIKFEEISLLFFDECHNTAKKHPYQMIMDIYFEEKKQGKRLPQIVGLTATPGSGNASNTQQAYKHIQTLFACLDVTIPPVTVSQNSEELEQYVATGNFETIPVKRSAVNKFSVLLKDHMSVIEKNINKKMEKNANCISDLQFSASEKRGTQEYEQCIISFDKALTLKITENKDLHLELKVYAQQLLTYNNALIVDEQLRPCDSCDFIEQQWKKDYSENCTLRTLKELYENSGVNRCADITPSPVLKQLVELLKHHFTLKPDSRCIVFVRTRAVAQLLANCLNEDPQLIGFNLNATHLTGSGAAASEGGLTKKQQDRCLDVFRKGDSKVIAATSIADEGIDIKRCNLVVTYNHGTNEITEIQRKGRGRAKDSQMVVLCYEDCNFIAQQKINHARQILVEQSMKIFRDMDKEQFKKEVEEIQKELSELSQEVEPRQYDEHVWMLYCKKCQTFVTTSANIWKIKNAHHVVVDKDFADKCVIINIKNKKIDEVTLIGNVLCNKPTCRNPWGKYIVYRNGHHHILSISGFFIEKEGKREIYKKWCQAPIKFDRSFDDYLNRSQS